jgi:SWI/SNF-related matrix-associated actin-dependent regulator of chromatin subfamily A3
VAHPGEYVKLIREPTNPYDSNAIRVDNIRNEKVGHIKATTAMTLAKVMDQFLPPTPTTESTGTSTIYMDGTIAFRGATSYSLPLQLDFYSQSKSNYMADLVHINNALNKLIGWKPDKALMTLLRSSSLKSDAIDVEVTNQTLNWEDAQKNLDVMFDQLVNDQLNNLPPLSIPETIITPLLEHQIDGIRWLYHHEVSMNEQQDAKSKAGALSIPFYKQIQERGKKVWLSEITNATQTDPPKPIGGSIL